MIFSDYGETRKHGYLLPNGFCFEDAYLDFNSSMFLSNIFGAEEKDACLGWGMRTIASTGNESNHNFLWEADFPLLKQLQVYARCNLIYWRKWPTVALTSNLYYLYPEKNGLKESTFARINTARGQITWFTTRKAVIARHWLMKQHWTVLCSLIAMAYDQERYI